MPADEPFDELLMNITVNGRSGFHPCENCPKCESDPKLINENTLQTFITKLSTQIDSEYSRLTSPFAAWSARLGWRKAESAQLISSTPSWRNF